MSITIISHIYKIENVWIGSKSHIVYCTDEVYKLIFSTIHTIQHYKLFQTQYVSLTMMASPLNKHKCCFIGYVT